ncbi:MAG TPA: type VI secretion system lipoprotein TssJ [Steroidobacteraceae bacterium]|nr:type VI secretion system lipoprotein TssJ [Steroidobacteraceae bacterium]
MGRGYIARCLCVLALVACKSAPPPPPKPVVTELEVGASSDINPDPEGRASPLVLRVFQLRTDAEFAGANYFPLYDKEKDILAAALISRDEFNVAPGGHVMQELPVAPDARYIGVLAAYRDAAAQWRALAPLPPKPAGTAAARERHITVRLNKAAVVLTIN